MAMSSWITLASSAAWGSGPSITAKFEYCYERSGADMRYQVRITINTLPYSTSYFGYPIYATVKLDSATQVSGYTIKNASPSQWSSALVYTTGVMTVSNKTSGSTSLSINLYSGSGESRDLTYSYSLTVAPAASAIDSVSNIETGSPVSVKWTPRNSAFKYNLTFKIGSTTIKSVTGVSPGSTSQYNYTGYTPAHSELPSSTSATVSVTLDTYSGSTKIGSDTKNFTLSVPASVVPSISSLSVSAVNNIAAFGSRFVAGKSAAQWSCSASPGSGSSIKGYVFSFAGVSGVAASGTTDIIPSDGSFTPSVTVTDNRGRSATYTGPAIIVYPYANPVVTTAVAERCNGSGTADESGTQIAVLLSATCSPVGGSNSVTVRARKRATGGNWGSYTTLTQGSRIVLSGAVSTTSSYQVELSAIDTAGNETIILVSIPTAGVPFHLRKGGKGAAFGKYSEKQALECAWPAEFKGNVEVTGELSAKGGSIELNRGGTLANFGGYIDFHFNKSANDYTSRIIEDGSGHISFLSPNGVSMNGGLNVAGASTVAGKLSANGGLSVTGGITCGELPIFPFRVAVCKKASTTQSAVNDYWSIKCPAETGYTRIVASIHTGEPASIIVKNYDFNGDYIRVYTQNTSGAQKTFAISVAVLFIPDDNIEEITT